MKRAFSNPVFWLIIGVALGALVAKLRGYYPPPEFSPGVLRSIPAEYSPQLPGLNGVEATRQLQTHSPEVKVVALSACADKQLVLAMLEAGASAYVVKESGGEEVLRALRAVIQRRKYLSPEAAEAVVDGYVDRIYPTQEAAHNILTTREREVLQLVAEGKSSKAIGAQLSVSFHTVEAHRCNLMQKLSLHSTAELTKYAIRQGITTA